MKGPKQGDNGVTAAAVVFTWTPKPLYVYCLVLVELRGFEPLTPSMRTPCRA
jgi:hypothetical protein